MSYEIYDSNQQPYLQPSHPPAPPPPPPRGNSGWIALGIVAVILIPVVIVLACGFGGILLAAAGDPTPSTSPTVTTGTSASSTSTPAPRETIRPTGAPYSWQLPSGYVTASAPADLSGPLENTAAAVLAPADTTNILLTGSSTLPVDTGTLAEDALRKEIDSAVTTLGHDPRTGQAVSVHGYSAYRYDFTFAGAHAYSYFVFEARTMVQVLCRWSDREPEVTRGCDDLLATLTID